MKTDRPIASLSLDTDNLWSYLKTHGDPGWEKRPTYLPTFLPIALEALGELGLSITFFVVGVDADRVENQSALSEITRQGHEVGNHSYEHEPWLHRYDEAELEREIARTEQALLTCCGQKPVGFRGPGFSWSPTLLELLARRGYWYDASTFPTWMGPLARSYYFRTARLSPPEREERAALFGKWSDGLRPLRPYRWKLSDGRSLLEIPVTTFPGLRVPFHLSYLLYLARVSERLMAGYLRMALVACRTFGVQPSFLLHPLDLLGGDLVPALRFFPGMDLDTAAKLRLFERVHRILGRHFLLVPMSTHALLLTENPALGFTHPELSVR
jgi:hypothetical protein